MSVVNLHPEDLLEKLARDEVTPSERVRLDTHLAACAVCRLEQAMRADFADDLAEELEGKAPISTVPLLVAGAMRAPAPHAEAPQVEADVAPLAPLAPVATPPVAPLVRSRRWPARRLVAFLAAAAVLVAGVAGASGWAGRVWSGSARTLAPASTPTSKVEAQPVSAVARASAPAPVHGARLSEPEAEPVIEPAAVAPPLASPPSPAARAFAAPKVPDAKAPRVERAAEPLAEAPTSSSASTVFDAANAARRRGDHEAALRLYRELQARHPRSAEAQMSRVSMARLQLDRGDAASALAGFEGYLRGGGGDLREDAMVGRATALERLGRVADEAAAWSALLDAFPGSAHAAHARSRAAGAAGAILR